MPLTTTSPYDIGRSFTRQGWRDVVFLHWRVPPETVRPLLPPGVEPDVRDGSSWLGVIGLRMTGLRVGGVPYPSFLELNVRLYSVDANGHRGVVFRAMEATDPVFAAAARTSVRLPYTWAAMRFEQHGQEIEYRTRRHWPKPSRAGVRLKVRCGAEIEPTPLETALTARWALHQRWYGPTLRMPIDHEPWPLRRAETLAWEDDGLLEACGLPTMQDPPESALYASGTSVRFGLPQPQRK